MQPLNAKHQESKQVNSLELKLWEEALQGPKGLMQETKSSSLIRLLFLRCIHIDWTISNMKLILPTPIEALIHAQYTFSASLYN